MENKIITEITNCTKCEFHSVESDPDLYDWFCDDDVKVVCTKCNRNITCACRPYKIVEESDIPSWCPRLKNE